MTSADSCSGHSTSGTAATRSSKRLRPGAGRRHVLGLPRTRRKPDLLAPLLRELQDQRALRLLETKLGREAVEKLIDFGCGKQMTFSEYLHGESCLLSLRELVNRMLSSK